MSIGACAWVKVLDATASAKLLTPLRPSRSASSSSAGPSGTSLFALFVPAATQYESIGENGLQTEATDARWPTLRPAASGCLSGPFIKEFLQVGVLSACSLQVEKLILRDEPEIVQGFLQAIQTLLESLLVVLEARSQGSQFRWLPSRPGRLSCLAGPILADRITHCYPPVLVDIQPEKPLAPPISTLLRVLYQKSRLNSTE